MLSQQTYATLLYLSWCLLNIFVSKRTFLSYSLVQRLQTIVENMSSQKFNYKLTYFNVKGAGEVTRMMFAAAGVKYTDERVSFEDWPKLKPSKTFYVTW